MMGARASPLAQVEQSRATCAALRDLVGGAAGNIPALRAMAPACDVLCAAGMKRMTIKGDVLVPVVLGLLAVAAGGCTTEPEPAPATPPNDEEALQASVEESGAAIEAEVAELEREQVAGDVYHYSFLLKVGNTPNARVRVHRVVREDAPWRARPASQAIMLLHGDFATFTTNFAPSRMSTAAQPDHDLAAYLAERGIDVWGLDRRWTTAPEDGTDFSDFADMGVEQAISDTGRALVFARSIRTLTGAGQDRMFLGGFSSGAQITYLYAADETQKKAEQRQIKGIVPIDIYATLSPEDADLKQLACDAAAQERDLVAKGEVDSDNSAFWQPLGELAVSAPSDPSPLFSGYTNRETLLGIMTQTYLIYAPKPKYHLVSGVFTNEAPTGLRYAPEALITDWLVNSPPHQALVESADRDALWCGEAPLPIADHLADIEVPLFYLGAAGGFGDHGLHTTTVVASTDVTTHVVRRLAVESEPEDFGHADLLYADDAPTLAWEPLSKWLLAH